MLLGLLPRPWRMWKMSCWKARGWLRVLIEEWKLVGHDGVLEFERFTKDVTWIWMDCCNQGDVEVKSAVFPSTVWRLGNIKLVLSWPVDYCAGDLLIKLKKLIVGGSEHKSLFWERNDKERVWNFDQPEVVNSGCTRLNGLFNIDLRCKSTTSVVYEVACMPRVETLSGRVSAAWRHPICFYKHERIREKCLRREDNPVTICFLNLCDFLWLWEVPIEAEGIYKFFAWGKSTCNQHCW